MSMWTGRVRVVLVTLVLVGMLAPTRIHGQSTVRAVLFFSPTCPHCHQVINEDLPVIFEQFGGTPRVWVDEGVLQSERAVYYLTNGTLEILLVDASRPVGGLLYDRATQQFAVPPERMGVPRLVIGDSLLVGSIEIPSRLPDMVQQAAASGGLDWPPIEGLSNEIPDIPVPAITQVSPDTAPTEPVVESDAPAEQGPAADSAGVTAPSSRVDEPEIEPSAASPGVVESTLESVSSQRDGTRDRFARDPVGNGLAVIVLLATFLSVYVVFARAPGWRARSSASALVPLLTVAGMAVAAYLSYVEASGATAVCGPVGDCNAVQQSPYARMFGLPVGLLGLIGYAAIAGAWLGGRGKGRLAAWSNLVQFGFVFVGVLFSSYLTFLEPFVIGATCLWCLTSAVIMTLLLWLTAGPGFGALASLRSRG